MTDHGGRPEGLRLHDTMAGVVRDFAPLHDGHVSIYLCGATVQGLPHIGHVRSGVAFDVLRRWLTAKGFDVAFIRNVTDIDDKILNKAADAGRPWWEWAATFERAFTAAYDALGVLPPSVEPRATGHITQMVELIERLIAGGHAYASGGDVYFNVLSFPDYGRLSGHRIDDVHQGEGVATGKRDERDFTLWKGAKPGEPSWPTPWGRGRPGWHTECVAMCEAYLGSAFDIHAGGMDLVFPHHENEIAQGVCAHGHAHEPNAHAEYSRYWMHNGFLTVDAEKMSKSIGNVLLLHDLVQNIPGEVVRWALLSAHYRQPLDWNQSLLDQSRKALDRLYGALHRAAGVEANGDEPPEDFLKAIEDDINTPGAMATLFALSSEIERAMTAGDIGVVARAKGELIAAAAILGVLQADPATWFDAGVDDAFKAEVETLLEQRAAARAGKDWPEADRIRDRLNALNVVVMDGPTGATWRVKG